MERSTTSMILRAKQAYVGLLCEKQTLEYGICYFSHSHASLPLVNQYREVIASTAEQAKCAINEAASWFHQHGLVCHLIAPAVGYTSSELYVCFESHNYVSRKHAAMALVRWESPSKPGNMRVLPARAVRQAYRTAVANSITTNDNEYRGQIVDAYIARLDSPQLDAFVVMDAGQPVGYGGLFQVGDIALLTDICVEPKIDPHDARSALLAHILTLAKRLELRSIYFELVDGSSDELKETLESWGFVSDGTIEEFQLATP